MNKQTSSPYLHLDREKWATLRDENDEALTLTQEELDIMKGINHRLSIEEVKDVYLPLSRLLYYYVHAQTNRQTVLMNFLKENLQKIPFIIGIAGSVSVGKSTTARVLQKLLSRWKENLRVSLVTTDGFLYPNAVLEEKGLLLKKGFPQSYDVKRLLQFVSDIKSGKSEITIPKYSHQLYDILPSTYDTIYKSDIVLLEGLNVLQSEANYPGSKPRVFISDYVDFSIYVDAEIPLLETWFVSRFMKFKKDALSDPNSFFHTFAHLPDKEAIKIAQTTWREINCKNLIENILPTRERADLILHKADNHDVDYVRLRK